MSAPVVPWARTTDERAMRRALRSLTGEQRAICEAVANGEQPARHWRTSDIDTALAALAAAFHHERN